ncbi:MAG: hypothetical protein WC347_02860 [Smithellaceae bacterium]|jgi:hypothetical protein
MTKEEENKLKNDVRELQEFKDFIIRHFHLQPKAEELEPAVAAFLAGDPSALKSYKQRGGNIGGPTQ